MPGPFYNAIKGTTAGTPGTGAFTPNAASSGFRAWSTVPTGWIGMVRYEDGSSWELTYSYWNGTTLSRASTQLYDSSSGSAISLTSAATAAMIVDAREVMSHLGGTAYATWRAVDASNAVTSNVGLGTPTTTGTAAGSTLATTNYLTEQSRTQFTSATTASAQAGLSWSAAFAVVSTSAGHGGFEYVARFGASALPTGPRLFVGMSNAGGFIGATEPGSVVGNVVGFGKDSTDTNIQLMVNDNSGGSNKTDTGFPLTANGWYEITVWCDPGSNKVYGLLIRIDTGDIWFGSTTTGVPVTGALLSPYVVGGLNASNTGTAIVMQIGSIAIRSSQ